MKMVEWGLRKKAEKKEVWVMTTQYKESRREDCHKFLGLNDDMDIIHPIQTVRLNFSPLSASATHTPF